MAEIVCMVFAVENERRERILSRKSLFAMGTYSSKGGIGAVSMEDDIAG